MPFSSLRKSCGFLCIGVALAGALSAQGPPAGIAREPPAGIAREPQGGIRQQAVAPEHRYFRMIALVHMVGTGKQGDPIRPEFVANGGPNLNKAAPATLSPAAAAKSGGMADGSQVIDENLVAQDHVKNATYDLAGRMTGFQVMTTVTQVYYPTARRNPACAHYEAGIPTTHDVKRVA